MDQISTKTWVLIGTIGMVLFGSYMLRVGMKRSSWAPAAATFSYEMPRPKNYEPGFDLADRGVDRHYKTLPALPGKPTLTPAPAKPGVKPAVDVKAEAARKAFAAKAAAAQKAAAERKKKASVNVVDTSRPQEMSGLANNGGEDTNQYYGNNYNAARKTTAPKATDEEKKEEEKDEDDGLSLAQWRSLMQMAPTPKNVARFLKAKQRGKIESAGYYMIVHELLIDTAEDRRKAGLAILDSDASATTFAFMVTEAEQAPMDVQPLLKAKIETYSEPARFSFLIRVLGTSDQVNVLTAAAERVTKALANYKQVAQNTNGGMNNPPTPGQPSRQVAGGLTAQHFLAFVSTLQKLSKHTNGTISAQANTLLMEIQAVTKTTSGPGNPGTPGAPEAPSNPSNAS